MSIICVLLFLLCYFTIHRIDRKCSFGHLNEGGVSVDSHMDMSQTLGHALERRWCVC